MKEELLKYLLLYVEEDKIIEDKNLKIEDTLGFFWNSKEIDNEIIFYQNFGDFVTFKSFSKKEVEDYRNLIYENTKNVTFKDNVLEININFNKVGNYFNEKKFVDKYKEFLSHYKEKGLEIISLENSNKKLNIKVDVSNFYDVQYLTGFSKFIGVKQDEIEKQEKIYKKELEKELSKNNR